MLEVTNSDIDMNSFYEDIPFRFKLKCESIYLHASGSECIYCILTAI